MDRNSARRLSLAASFIFPLFLSGLVVAAQDFSRLVVFGDSLTDPGNAFLITRQVSFPPYDVVPSAPYLRGGFHFSNGKTWVEQFAQGRARSSVCPALSRRGNCSNYAIGGARARPGTDNDLSGQVVRFLGDFSGGAPSDALYVVHIGGNDVRDAIAALLADSSGAASQVIIRDAVGAVANHIVMLTSSGAREFLVANAPDLALTPAVRLLGPQAQGAAHTLSVAFNDALATALSQLEAGLPVTIHRFDVFGILNETVANPAAVGLTEVEEMCIRPLVIRRAECRHPQDFLFWDGIHPTKAGHAILARRARELMSLPDMADELEGDAVGLRP
jgi:phospholipase/lecithinase/hemolysin